MPEGGFPLLAEELVADGHDEPGAHPAHASYGEDGRCLHRENPQGTPSFRSEGSEACSDEQRAYETFFRRVKAGQPAGFPRFKSTVRFNSITFPSYGDDCKLKEKRLYIQGVGTLKVKLHRPVGGTIKTVTLKRVRARWYVVIVCEVAVVPLPATGQAVGIDLGLTSFLMTDMGKPVEHPQPLRAALRRLRRAQRCLARK